MLQALDVQHQGANRSTQLVRRRGEECIARLERGLETLNLAAKLGDVGSAFRRTLRHDTHPSQGTGYV